MTDSNDSKIPTGSNTRFLQAHDWNQEIAIIRAEIIERDDQYIKSFQGKLGVKKLRQRYIELFNNGLIDRDLKEKWDDLNKKLNRVRDSKISVDKLYDWKRRFNKDGLSGLLESYNNGGIRTSPKITEAIHKLIWGDHLIRYQDIYEYLPIICKDEKLPTYQTIRNLAKEYKKDNWSALVLQHEGQKGLRDRNMQVALGHADENLTRPGQRLEMDVTLADLFTERKVKDVVIKTKEGKRSKIIGVIEDYSRSIKFYLTEKETSLVVGQVIRDRILAWGVPEEIVIDNGKPFKNKRISHFLRSIGVSCHICIPGNPVEKPFIERAFRTLTEKLFRRLPGYSGNSVQTRPNEIQIEYTMVELQEIIDRYITNVYAETVHSSTGQRPRERISPPGFIPKTINERDLDILLMEEHERKVHQGYIAFHGGKYFNPKLPEGRSVKIRINDFDASEILVFVDRKFLCVAKDLQRKGRTPTEIQEAKKERNRELRTRIKAHEALIDKQKPKDVNILALIDHYEKNKPVELPKKADLQEFPELKGINYTRPESEDHAQDTSKEDVFGNNGQRLIRNNQEMYLDVMRRKLAGNALDDIDNNFLEDFLQSSEYRMIGPYLEEQLQRGMINER